MPPHSRFSLRLCVSALDLLLRGLGFFDDGSVVFVEDEDGEFADVVEFACAEGDVVEAAAEVGVAIFEETVLAIA